jgi:transcriptional regulator with XRE-family HTH domain
VGKSSNTCLLPEDRLADIRSRLATVIRTRRHAAGLTQSQLGSPLTKAFVGQLEAGLALPSLPTFIVLAERLGMTPEDLLRAVNGS